MSLPGVSAIVACRAGEERHVERCLGSLRAQAEEVELVVVAERTDAEEAERELARIEASGVAVLRLPVAGGVAACLNAGVANSSGSHVLPVEAGSTLGAGAVSAALERLAAAGDDVVFAYPAVDRAPAGAREEPAAYNLASLVRRNRCHLSSLVDRRVFDAGVRYSERAGGPESSAEFAAWDLVLELAERGMHGVPAPGAVVRTAARESVRPWHADLGAEMRMRHPELYDAAAAEPAPALAVKARWSPAISLIELEPGAGERRQSLELAVAGQTCRDIELVEGTGSLGDAVSAGRGRMVVATSGSAAGLMSDRAFAERLLRGFGDGDPYALVLAAAGEASTWQLLPSADPAAAHTVAWHPGRFDGTVEVDGSAPIASFVEALARRGVALQWRHWPAAGDRPSASGGTAWGSEVPLAGAPPRDAGEAAERAERLAAAPLLPAAPRAPLPATPGLPAWTPRDTALISRYRRGGSRLVAEHGAAPDGYELDFWLGTVDRLPRPGTVALIADASGGCREAPLGEPPRDGERLLGYLESEPFFPLEPIVAGRDAAGARLVAAGASDPLTGQLADERTLGYLQPFPPPPRQRPGGGWLQAGVTGLLRSLDLGAGRHRYAAGSAPPGEQAGELGALLSEPGPGLIPLSIDADGRVTGPEPDGRPGVSPAGAARWVAAPTAWSDIATPAARARAVGRRAAQSARAVLRRGAEPAPGATATRVAGYLHPERAPAALGRPELLPLYSAVHPVTGDRLLTTNPHEPGDLGYGEAALLGHLIPAAPVTGRLGIDRLAIPWASRFGERVRS